MTQQQLLEIVGKLAGRSNEDRQALVNSVAYVDRELAALVAQLSKLADDVAANDVRLDALDEAKVLNLVAVFRQEMEELGIDTNGLAELISKTRTNERDISVVSAEVAQLKKRMDAADQERAALRETQGDHGKRITALELREDQVGIQEEDARRITGEALQALSNGIGELAITYMSPVTGQNWSKPNFVRGAVAVADPAPADGGFSDA